MLIVLFSLLLLFDVILIFVNCVKVLVEVVILFFKNLFIIDFNNFFGLDVRNGIIGLFI